MTQYVNPVISNQYINFLCSVSLQCFSVTVFSLCASQRESSAQHLHIVIDSTLGDIFCSFLLLLSKLTYTVRPVSPHSLDVHSNYEGE